MLTIEIRTLLILVSFVMLIFVLRKIKKSQFVIEDTLYWLLFSVLLLLLSIFPGISYYFSNLLGFQSPSNFIFISFIFLLLVKIFFMSVRISELQTKLTDLIQKYALDQHESETREQE